MSVMDIWKPKTVFFLCFVNEVFLITAHCMPDSLMNCRVVKMLGTVTVQNGV